MSLQGAMEAEPMRHPVLAMAVMSLAASAACHRPAEPIEEIIAIGSVGTPAEVASGKAFTAWFTAGTCYSLRRVERDTSANTIDLTFVGVPEECPRGPAGSLEWVPFIHSEQIQAPATGDLSIIVHLPGGSVMTRLVHGAGAQS